MKTENILLGRTEIQEEIQTDKTPTKEEVKKSLAKANNVDESLVVVKHIYQKYGSNKVTIFANIYKDQKTLDLHEKINKKKKKVSKDKPAEAPKEEGTKTTGSDKEEKKPEKVETVKEQSKETKDGKEGSKE